MSDLDFFGTAPRPTPLERLAAESRVEIPAHADPTRTFRPVWSLDRAGRDDVTFLFAGDDDDLIATLAGACFVRPQDLSKVPATAIALVTDDPLDAFRRLVVAARAEALALRPNLDRSGISQLAVVHNDARLEQGVDIAPGAVVGPRAEIGTTTSIGEYAVIGAGVRIGRGCRIGAHVTIRDALIGDRVLVHAGARVGTSAPDVGPAGSMRTPRVGRVIIQDDAEIGPNAVIDRGLVEDTLIGDRARIGALVFVEGGRMIDRCRTLGADAFSLQREMS